MELSLGFSPCPNDTFIFDALVNKKIDTQGIDFKVYLEDVQTLNEWALAGKLAVSKISYGVLPLLLHQYKVLNSGGALGKGVGPLLISKQAIHANEVAAYVQKAKVAIPGVNTTAHLLFSLAFPKASNKQFMVFNQIEDAVLSGKTDAGVIIHENRFTYQEKGLQKLIDLGAFWEEQLQVPIPLGGIIAHQSIGQTTALLIDQLITQSVEYAFAHYPQLTDYTKLHAQEMSEDVMRKHIDLYVNNYSIHLGEEGKKAVFQLLKVYQSINHLGAIDTASVFIDS